jgi:hypothetical protein
MAVLQQGEKTVLQHCSFEVVKVGDLHSPDLELQDQRVSLLCADSRVLKGELTNESHDPVHKLIPSLLTPRQLTRLSWPTKDPTFSPRVTSQT